jgi:hypothetical protein
MQKLQRNWRPDPFYFQDQITFQGRPTGVKKYKYEHRTKSMVDKLRAVTRARRRIWDVEARKWNMRFPVKDNGPEPLENINAMSHIRAIQQTLAPQPVQQRTSPPAMASDQIYDDFIDYHSSDQQQRKISSNQDFEYHQDPQEALLLPQPSPDTFDMPERINTAVVRIQSFVRSYQTYRFIRASLSYKQLMTWARLHRNSLNRTKSDKQHAFNVKLGLGIAKLQAMYRGWRGRGKAKFVKHRVHSAATSFLQKAIIRPFLAKRRVTHLRVALKWYTMSSKMSNVQQIQRWYRCRREGRMARIILQVLKQNRYRLSVIKRMSETYGFHICSTGLWNAKKILKEQAQQLQWATRHATMVQSVIRAWGAKKAIHLLRTAKRRKEERRQKCATMIQSLYRGYAKRGEVVKRAYFVVQEAARRRWVVRASDDSHRNEILTNERLIRNQLIQNEINKKLRENVLSYTINETPSSLRNREKNRHRVIPDSINSWYDGPHFTKEELFSESDNDSELGSDDDGDSPRYW